jgi:hypothetical protein
MELREKRSCRLAGQIACAALITVLAGCSTAPDRVASQEEATVKGTVKLHGKILDAGELNFNAVNPNRRVEVRKATIGKDGSYTAKVYIGQNIVTVFPPRPRNKEESKDFSGAIYDEKTINVRTGENTSDFEFLP